MKTLKLFILVSLLACITHATLACGPFYFSAADNRIYRIVPPLWEEPTTVNDDFATQNVNLWSKQTGCGDVKAIREAIYEGSLAEWEEFYCQEKIDTKLLGTFGDNAFIRHLAKQNDTNAIKVLYLSKLYESVRNAQRSPWYYNSRIDSDEKQDLKRLYECLEQCMPFEGKYSDRYHFLAIKSLWALGDYSNAVELWENNKKRMKNSIFYDEAEDYVARSYTSMGKGSEAESIYRRHENFAELLPANAKLSDKLRVMLSVNPNSPKIVSLLQDYLSELDREQAATYFWDDIDTKSIYAVAKEALANPKVRNKAMWRYALACILEYKDKYAEALAMLKGAENGDGDNFLRKSVRILTFHLRARVDDMDDDFERYAMNEVKWLDKELQNEWKRLPKEVQHDISEVRYWEDISNLNKLYAYSSLRRIVLEDSIGLAWRMADAGYGVRALQMANVSDNRVFDISHNQVVDALRTSDKVRTPERDGIRRLPYWNTIDYSNGLFVLADKMDARTIEEYRQRQIHPKDDNDRWFNDRGYTSSDYWQDIVGTHYLREQNYQAAIAHLKYVSPHYQRQMNIQFTIDPFSVDRTKKSQDSTQYKLHFALKMDSLQHDMSYKRGGDNRGLAMLEFSIGLENSFDMCWWLTSYQRGWTGPALTDIEDTHYGKNARMVVKKLRKRALKTLRTDDARAQYYLRLGYYNKVKKQYSHTVTATLLALACDERWHYRN